MSWWGIGTAVGSAIHRSIDEDKRQKAIKSAADTQAAGVQAGITETRTATQIGQGFLEPAAEVGQLGIEQAGFLTDPQAQFDFLQNNPLFQMALESADVKTQNLAAARGRVSAGDTLEQLSQNVLLSAQPLVQQQKASITDLINLASGTGVAQANVAIGAGTNVTELLTQGANVGAASTIAQANLQAQTDAANREAISSSILASRTGRT